MFSRIRQVIADILAAITENSRAVRQNTLAVTALDVELSAFNREKFDALIGHAEFLATSKKSELVRSGHSK
jgi:hypothetical protein